jgi:hypothetical protein
MQETESSNILETWLWYGVLQVTSLRLFGTH